MRMDHGVTYALAVTTHNHDVIKTMQTRAPMFAFDFVLQNI